MLTKITLFLLLFISFSVFAEDYNPLFPYEQGKVYTVTLPQLALGKPNIYTGTFKPFRNRITGQSYYIMDTGEYKDSRGFRYVGVFDYLPLKYHSWTKTSASSGGGVFIFAGERTDELMGDEAVSGIFISDTETPFVQYAFNLAEATPEYMTQLYSRAESEVEETAQDSLNTSQRNRNFGLLLNVLSGVLSVAGGNFGNISNLTSSGAHITDKAFIARQALTVVSKTVSGEEDFKTAMKGAAGATIKETIKKSGGGNASMLIDAFDALSSVVK